MARGRRKIADFVLRVPPDTSNLILSLLLETTATDSNYSSHCLHGDRSLGTYMRVMTCQEDSPNLPESV